VRLAEAGDVAGGAIDERLARIVRNMFTRCMQEGQCKQAIGIALETHSMDVFEEAIAAAGDEKAAMLTYAFQVAMSLIQQRRFRHQVLRSLVKLYRNLHTPDYVNMVQCLIYLEDPLSVAHLLTKLANSSEDSCLMAHQIAFDLYDSATQQFLGQVQQSLKASAPLPFDDKEKSTDAAVEQPVAKSLDSLVGFFLTCLFSLILTPDLR
jgi:26S proteasome regulatory subunit N2